MRDARRAARSPAWVGPHVCGVLLRGARGDAAARSAALEPAARRDHVAGGRRRSTSARACGPSSSAPASACIDVSPLHARVARPLLLPPRRRRRRPAGRADPDAGHDRRAAPTRSRDGLAAVRERIAAACAGAGREPGRGHPGRRHQVLPGLRRAPARRPRRRATSGRTATRRPSRRPRSAPTSTCAGTSSAGCRATRRPRSRATPTSCTPSTAPSCVAGLSRGAHERGPRPRLPRPGRASTATRSATAAAGCDPGRRARPGRRAIAARPRGCGCAV